ncbi:MAG: type IV secretion system DNA-binding domain-containing protein [Pseudomonadota bacterium]
MDEHSAKPVYDLGALPPSAPSTKRVDLLGWICASGMLGILAGWIATRLVWRAFPGLEEPPGSFGFHADAVLRWVAHWLWKPAFIYETKAYAAFLSGLSDHARNALIWRACVGAWATAMPAILLAKGCLTPRDGLIVLRGAARHEGPDAVVRLNAVLARRAQARPDHAIAPGVIYPADMWTRHVLVVGGVGSGKSTALKPLIATVINAGESMLLFDPKGEFTKGFSEPGLMAPWDKRSLSWDIARDMRNIGDMRRFSAAMIREAQDPMWSNAARQILVGFMIYLKTTRGADWGWRELAELMAIPQARILPMMSKYHPEAVRSVERASVTTQGILINLSSFSASIFDLAEAWGDVPQHRRVSFVDWAHGRGKHRQLILQGHGAYPDLTKGYLEGVIGTVAAIVNSVEMDDDENRKLWIIADESAQMGKVPIRPLLEVGRSRGVRCVLACQDLAQLEEIHGAHMVKAMVSMSGTILVGQIMQGDTAEQMCKALGTKEVERVNVSSSYNGSGAGGRSSTLSFSRDELAIYKPAELASRLGPTPDGKGVHLALFTAGHAYELFWPHYTMKRARMAHVPAAWTQGFGRVGDAGDATGLPSFDADRGGSKERDQAEEGLAAPEATGERAVDAQAGIGWAYGDVDLETGEILSPGDAVGVVGDRIDPSSIHGNRGSTTVATDNSDNQAGGASRQRGLDGGQPSEGHASFSVEGPPSIGEIEHMLRASVEVQSECSSPAPTAVIGELLADMSGSGGPAGEESAALWKEAAIHAVGGEPASLLVQAVEIAESFLGRPGPVEKVRVVQRSATNGPSQGAHPKPPVGPVATRG